MYEKNAVNMDLLKVLKFLDQFKVLMYQELERYDENLFKRTKLKVNILLCLDFC